MIQKDREDQTPEQDLSRLWKMQQQFRQTYQMGRIFYELRKTEKSDYYHDQETGRVLFDSYSMSEGVPAALTPLIDPERGKAEREAWENRINEIVSATKTWLRILDDGALEIKYEHSRYDQGYITPTVGLDDVPEALSAMTFSMRSRKKEEDENLIEAIADRVSRSPHIVLRRSEETFILRPERRSGTVETSSWKQEYDSNGNITKDEVVEPVVYSVGNGNTDIDLMTLRFNMMSNLLYELNKAVESEAPEHYAARFTPAARQAILQMVLGEIQIAAENGEKKNKKEEVMVHGHCESRGDFIYPQAEYSRFCMVTVDDGVITVENTHIARDLPETFFASVIEVPAPTSKDVGFVAFLKASNEVSRVVDEWNEAALTENGEVAYRAKIKEEIERLKLALVNNEGTVHGQIRILTIDPRTGVYQYIFAQRIPEGALDNHTDNTVLEIHGENPQDPSCDELSTLLGLAI